MDINGSTGATTNIIVFKSGMTHFHLDYPRGSERTKIGSCLDGVLKRWKGINGLFPVYLCSGIKNILITQSVLVLHEAQNGLG